MFLALSPDAASPRRDLYIRPEYEHREVSAGDHAEIVQRRSLFGRLYAIGGLRRLVIVIGLFALWQGYAAYLNDNLLFPSFLEVSRAWLHNLSDGVLVDRVLGSLKVLVSGYVIGFVIAVVLTSLAVSSRIGSDLLSTLTAMFNPLPAIALLPLALLWFGIGSASLVFVIVHSVLWAVTLNMHTGFQQVPDAQRMAGRNYGIKGFRYVAKILIPAAFPSILAGLKIGWAFAWRTQIGAEMIFGTTSKAGGLGWFIFEARNELATDVVFAGLMTVIMIGLLFDGVFRWIENRTVRKWGTQR
jgi:NitT/TauT family transport system permease protein